MAVGIHLLLLAYRFGVFKIFVKTLKLEDIFLMFVFNQAVNYLGIGYNLK